MKRLLLVLVLTACGDTIGPLEFFRLARDAVAIPAPAAARKIWTELEACSGLSGDFDDVQWFVAPNGFQVDGKWKHGIWFPENIIVLAPNTVNNYITIKHEELHALLRSGGDHPAEYFNGACGDLMSPFMPS